MNHTGVSPSSSSSPSSRSPSWGLFALAALCACEPSPPSPAPPASPDSTDTGGIEACGPDEPVPADPGATLEGWSAVGGAVIDYNGIAALFLSDAVCAGDAEMRATVALPECYLPLAVDVRSNIVSGDTFGPLNATGVSLGAALLDFGYEEYDTTRCVGAAAFHGPGDLVIRPRTAYSSCEDAIAEVEAVSLFEQPDCPAPGTVTPFDAWTLNGAPGASRAEVVAGNLELEIVPGFCADASAQGPAIGAVSLPDTASAGIVVVADGDAAAFGSEDNYDGGMYMRVGRVTVRLHPGENTLCFPRAMRGSANRVDFSLTYESCSSASAPGKLVTVHPIEFTDACSDTDIVDGSFDDASPLWFLFPSYPGAIAAIADGTATLEAFNECDSPRMETPISVPEPAAEGGPAVRVHYALTGPGNASVSSGDVNLFAALPAAQTVATLCLPPSRAHDVLQLSIQATTETGGSGSCANPLPAPTRLDVDEVEVILDPACPGA